jgi:mevalonate kinase
MIQLFLEPTFSQAGCKCILLGEHSAIYGHLAIACSLKEPKLTLQATPFPAGKNTWQDSFELLAQGKKMALDSSWLHKLHQAFDLVTQKICRVSLDEITPAKIQIISEIPIGAGLGGSASLAVSIIRLVEKAAQASLSLDTCQALALEIDTLFHGSASGIDTLTILQEKAISFRRSGVSEPLVVGKPFHLVVVDSQERCATSHMVQKVSQLFAQKKTMVCESLDHLGAIAQQGLTAIAEGNLPFLAQGFRQAHHELQKLGVSTQKLNAIVEDLEHSGALGAKLSGGGGGGVALGLLDELPSPQQIQLWKKWGDCFIVTIEKTTVSN